MFEEGLSVELLNEFARSQERDVEFWELEKKEQRQLEKAVPLSLAGKIQLAHALGILPEESLADLEKAKKIRNRVTHTATALKSCEKEQANTAGQYFVEMRAFLAAKKLYSVELPELEL